jgi:hypothetical protein
LKWTKISIEIIISKKLMIMGIQKMRLRNIWILIILVCLEFYNNIGVSPALRFIKIFFEYNGFPTPKNNLVKNILEKTIIIAMNQS